MVKAVVVPAPGKTIVELGAWAETKGAAVMEVIDTFHSTGNKKVEFDMIVDQFLKETNQGLQIIE